MTPDALERDVYEVYAERFDPLRTDRQARRRRKPEAHHNAKRAAEAVLAGLVETTEELEGGFATTYLPGRLEAEWLFSSLRGFYERGLISDVLAIIQGGKEASVYRCAAHPATGLEWLAAKVYRPRKYRNLRNDALYREGRAILKADGSPVTEHDDRILRAVTKKTTFGEEVRRTSWLMHEYTALECLHAAGGAVPRPWAAGENAILMRYYGDAHRAAPTLNEVHLGVREARRLLREVVRNVALLLRHGLIHGDLSAYNILYWQGEIALIDFPQVMHGYGNRNARAVLRRDLARLCEYFARQGVACDPEALLEDLWQRHIGSEMWRAEPPSEV